MRFIAYTCSELAALAILVATGVTMPGAVILIAVMVTSVVQARRHIPDDIAHAAAAAAAVVLATKQESASALAHFIVAATCCVAAMLCVQCSDAWQLLTKPDFTSRLDALLDRGDANVETEPMSAENIAEIFMTKPNDCNAQSSRAAPTSAGSSEPAGPANPRDLTQLVADARAADAQLERKMLKMRDEQMALDRARQRAHADVARLEHKIKEMQDERVALSWARQCALDDHMLAPDIRSRARQLLEDERLERERQAHAMPTFEDERVARELQDRENAVPTFEDERVARDLQAAYDAQLVI